VSQFLAIEIKLTIAIVARCILFGYVSSCIVHICIKCNRVERIRVGQNLKKFIKRLSTFDCANRTIWMIRRE